jgi:hypothetical protein
MCYHSAGSNTNHGSIIENLLLSQRYCGSLLAIFDIQLPRYIEAFGIAHTLYVVRTVISAL